MTKTLLQRAAESTLGLKNITLGPAFKDRELLHAKEGMQLVCEGGENAERYLTALSGGTGYSKLHRGESHMDSEGGRLKVERFDIFRESDGALVGDAETYRDPAGALKIIAFEIKSSEILTISMIARALAKNP